ncbi:LacI family DNA-binding transcriptional regulator [Actinotalea sp. K2]|uniref:LacI family DNA-binding transcriptional regulator n=1 Tax=Actinotalea sp. K2 TaxID=2939438 RepID=UPI002017408C|nr:LacI family DNA-binding transcriptional regulator [Actinotalea sp. K2]MCL3861202.1 LacI family DNA-binding transcriptional regulator [Actinotalea sp. K2]
MAAKADTGKPATIYDVARFAGVSHQTVSRVLRGVGSTRPETRERVLAALEALHYRPNAAARELAWPRPRRIGVVGYETFESSTSKVLKGVNRVATEAGYVLDIVTVDPLGDVDEIVRRLSAINSSDVAGLLATSPTSRVREALERSVFRMPVFLDVNGEVDLRPGPYRGTSRAAQIAMRHLLELGHTRIAHVAGPTGWDSAANREAVYRTLLEEHGLESSEVVRGDWSAASGHRAARLLPGDAGITAVFVANDRMALGVIRALAERGVRVPEEVSVVGVDDIPEAAFFCPPLTTVHIDFAAGGEVAARSLISLIERPDEPPPLYPESRLVERQSTAPPALVVHP